MPKNARDQRGGDFKPDKEGLKRRLLEVAKSGLEAQLLSETITRLDLWLFGSMLPALERGEPISFAGLEWADTPAEIRTFTTTRLQLLGYSYVTGERTWFKKYQNPMVKLEKRFLPGEAL